MLTRLRNAYQRHQGFILVLLLFVSFRLLAILVMRPGGFFADTSDYDYYYAWGQLSAMGYRVYENLWSTYPPLFPATMFPIFNLSSRIPPWIEPRLFFHSLFGFWLLLFETGNLILVYRLGTRVEVENSRLDTEDRSPHQPISLSPHPGLTAAILYALLFVPVYTLIGWFESMPLFFLLLGLELMLVSRTWGWIGSAIIAALGFLTKFTPVILVPIAIRWLGAKLSWQAARDEWFNRKSPGNLLRPTIYVFVFVGTILGIGYWLTMGNIELALSSFTVNSMRPPWQSVWAVIDGYYGFGLVPADVRNMVALESLRWESKLPWTWITLAFLALYLWLYTRRYQWERIRTPVAFTAVSIIWLFLYSKGWSPQFLLWVLAFIVILIPNLLGIVLTIFLSLINFVEADIFLLLVPDEHWLLAATTATRTVLLILLAGLFLSQIWPNRLRGIQIRRWSGALSWLVMALALIGMVAVTPRIANAYQERRLAEHPCRDAIEYLVTQAGGATSTILTEELDVWQDFYPRLRNEYDLRVLDTYSAVDEPPADVLATQLDSQLESGEVWWVTWQDEAIATETYFTRDDVHIFDAQTLGVCTLSRVTKLTSAEQMATIDVDGGPIHLLSTTNRIVNGDSEVGTELDLVLYWRADAPVTGNYTVFTQLFDPSGNMIAQQDNLPVNGLAPTDTWAVDSVIRDPYRLPVPPNAPPGEYQLHIGLYDPEGRRPVTPAEGAQTDHVITFIEVGER